MYKLEVGDILFISFESGWIPEEKYSDGKIYNKEGGFYPDYLNRLSFDEIYKLAIIIKGETSVRYVSFMSFLSQKYNLGLINYNKNFLRFHIKKSVVKELVIEYGKKTFIINDKGAKKIESSVEGFKQGILENLNSNK